MPTSLSGPEQSRVLLPLYAMFRARQGALLTSSPQIYAGLRFKISISFPSNYPYAAPTIKFDTPCYHPNVDLTGGAICLDILQVCNLAYSRRGMILTYTQDKWSAVYSGQTILISLQSLLGGKRGFPRVRCIRND